jgi:hypothetical protein
LVPDRSVKAWCVHLWPSNSLSTATSPRPMPRPQTTSSGSRAESLPKQLAVHQCKARHRAWHVHADLRANGAEHLIRGVADDHLARHWVAALMCMSGDLILDERRIALRARLQFFAHLPMPTIPPVPSSLRTNFMLLDREGGGGDQLFVTRRDPRLPSGAPPRDPRLMTATTILQWDAPSPAACR